MMCYFQDRYSTIVRQFGRAYGRDSASTACCVLLCWWIDIAPPPSRQDCRYRDEICVKKLGKCYFHMSSGLSRHHPFTRSPNSGTTTTLVLSNLDAASERRWTANSGYGLDPAWKFWWCFHDLPNSRKEKVLVITCGHVLSGTRFLITYLLFSISITAPSYEMNSMQRLTPHSKGSIMVLGINPPSLDSGVACA